MNLEAILTWLLNQFGGLHNVVITAVVLLTAKVALPWLQAGTRMRYAAHLSHLADEITDDLIARYPDNRWTQVLDDAVDAVLKELGVNDLSEKRMNGAKLKKKKIIAERVVGAAINRCVPGMTMAQETQVMMALKERKIR
jgi:hypothetical protein